MKTTQQFVYILRHRPAISLCSADDHPVLALQKIAVAEQAYRDVLDEVKAKFPQCEVLCGPLAEGEAGFHFDFVLAHDEPIDPSHVANATVRRARGEIFFDGLHVYFAARDRLIKLGGEAADALLAQRHGLPCNDPAVAWREAARDWARDRLLRAANSRGRRRRILRIFAAALRRTEWTRLRIIDLQRRLDESIVGATPHRDRRRDSEPERQYVIEVVLSRSRSPWERSLRMVVHSIELMLPRRTRLWLGIREDDVNVASIEILLSGQGIDVQALAQEDVLVAARQPQEGEIFVTDRTILHVRDGSARELSGAYAYELFRERGGEVVADVEGELWASANNDLWDTVCRRLPRLTLDAVEPFTTRLEVELNRVDVCAIDETELSEIADRIVVALEEEGFNPE